MRFIKLASALVILISSTVAHADPYILLGAGLDIVKHNRIDDTPGSFPLLNVKVGVGFPLSKEFAIELEATATSSASLTNSATCTTVPFSLVSCTVTDEISRQLTTVSAVYTQDSGSFKGFLKGGLSFARSSYTATASSNTIPTTIFTDEQKSEFIGIFNVGFLYADVHRFGLVVSTGYGDSTIGKFSFTGLEYNYLLKWL
jgi:hypothetical protein